MLHNSMILKVGTDKKKLKERYVILCDGLLIVCSQTGSRRPSTSMASPASLGELRYRDKFTIRLINIGDREDEEGIKYSFELCPRDQQKVKLKIVDTGVSPNCPLFTGHTEGGQL